MENIINQILNIISILIGYYLGRQEKLAAFNISEKLKEFKEVFFAGEKFKVFKKATPQTEEEKTYKKIEDNFNE